MVEGADVVNTGADTTLRVKVTEPFPQADALDTVYTVVAKGAKVPEEPDPEGAHT